jgi:hypothetical protein
MFRFSVDSGVRIGAESISESPQNRRNDTESPTLTSLIFRKTSTYVNLAIDSSRSLFRYL